MKKECKTDYRKSGYDEMKDRNLTGPIDPATLWPHEF